MLQNRTTTYVQRIAIIERHEAGQSYHDIAHELGLNYYTVRKWCRAYRDASWQGIQPQSSRRQGCLSHFHPLVRYVALRLKRQHPGWGLDKILLEMRRRPALDGQRLPQRSTLHHYYQQFQPRLQDHRASRVQRPHNETVVQNVHDCWQMDFKGEEDLGVVGKVKPLVICDAYSSAPLATYIHSGQRSAVTTHDVQQDLRQTFSDWGLPASVRMDRDPIWVGSSRLEFPGRLLLWLIGLQIIPIINRAHRPTDNAQVERCNGIWFEQVARGQTYTSLAQVQAASDQARQDRLAHLPSRNPHCQHQAPLVALPQLNQPRIPYTIRTEPDLFDIRRVYSYLSHWRWQRIIDSSGQLSLGGFNRRIGSAFCGQVVKVHFDLETALFVASTLQGHELKRFSLPSITTEAICGTGMLE